MKPTPETKAEEPQVPVKKEASRELPPSTSPARVVNRAALASKKASAAGGSPEPAKAAVPAPDKRTIAVSEEEIEKAHNNRVRRLREVVDREGERKSPRKRESLLEMFAATVPDPIMEHIGD
ncbi:hypothetical protein [Pseudorhizobium pelagicum]|uniref:Uncharacterized protein n=1 Tax=Pseudorhizobium pelagicum TaxID=1509405 RepID=A0A922NXT8_9HYPH|nr:hypothetical protein [Pseudorhizobium pelagicum]KEQ02231.1 hypothetical protein GV67_22430 [Pseudorhizobium pelagicum]KEQ02259.1 hypothetical protein GV68_23550 [Pseudorhizobium pelagicum]